MSELTLNNASSTKVNISATVVNELKQGYKLLLQKRSLVGQLYGKVQEDGSILVDRITFPTYTPNAGTRFSFESFKADKIANETDGYVLAGLWDTTVNMLGKGNADMSVKDRIGFNNYIGYLGLDKLDLVKLTTSIIPVAARVKAYVANDASGETWSSTTLY